MEDIIKESCYKTFYYISNIYKCTYIYFFLFQTHEIVVPVYACMKERSMKSFTKATFLAMGILFVIYCMAGSFGYITFGSLIAPDIMEQYDANDPVVLIGIGALVIKMITTYPQLVLCGRYVATEIRNILQFSCMDVIKLTRHAITLFYLLLLIKLIYFSLLPKKTFISASNQHFKQLENP